MRGLVVNINRQRSVLRNGGRKRGVPRWGFICIKTFSRGCKHFAELVYSKCHLDSLSRLPSVNQLWATGRNSWLWKKGQRFLHCLLQHYTGLWNVVGPTCKSTSNAPRNWCREWTIMYLVWCHTPWPGSCQSGYVLTTCFIPRHERQKLNETQRERLSKAFN